MKRLILVLLTVAVAMVLIGTALAQRGRGSRGHGRHGMMGSTASQTPVACEERQAAGLCAQLTAEERAEMISLRAGLRADGATPEQIHAAMGELFTEKGIDLPEGWAEHPAFCLTGEGWSGSMMGMGGLCAQLAIEDRQELQELRSRLWAAEATREEIHAAVGQWLEEHGIELPEDWADRPFAGPGRGGLGHHGQRGLMGLGLQLTAEDWQELQTLRSSLWEADKTPEQIHAAVGEWLTEKGIELPEGWAERPAFCRIRGGFGRTGMRGAGGPGWRGCWGASGAGASPDESVVPDEESTGDQRTSDLKQEVPPTAVEKQSWGEVKKETKESE